MLDILVELTPLHLNKKIQETSRPLSGKTLDVLPQIFLTNSNDSNRCHSKIDLGHAVFQLLSGSTFSLKLTLLLNNLIS